MACGARNAEPGPWAGVSEESTAGIPSPAFRTRPADWEAQPAAGPRAAPRMRLCVAFAAPKSVCHYLSGLDIGLYSVLLLKDVFQHLRMLLLLLTVALLTE